MNPQYIPPQFGVQQPSFAPGKTPSNLQDPFGMSTGVSQPQSPGGYQQQGFSYGYKGAMGPPTQNNAMPPPIKQMPSGPNQANQPGMGVSPLSQVHNGPAPPQMMSPTNDPNQGGLLPPQGHSPQRQVTSPSGSMPPPPPSQLPPPTNQIPPTQLPPTSGGAMMPPPTNQMGPNPGQMQPLPPPSSFGAPPPGMGAPPAMGQPPTSHPQPGQMQLSSMSQVGAPPTGATPGHMGPPPTGQPPNQMGPPPSHMGPPQSHMGPPPGQMGPPGSMSSAPPGSMGPSPGLMPTAPPQGTTAPAQLGVQQTQMAPPQPGQMRPGLGPMGGPTGMNQQTQPMNRPLLGQAKPQPMMPPSGGSFGPPPPMGQGPPRPGMPPTGHTGPFMPPKQSGPYNMPPVSSPYQQSATMPPTGVAQLSNQMSDMHLGGGGPRQYPGAPMKPALNGENYQQQNMAWGGAPGVNGAQNRLPQSGQYPPVPGQQQQMPGGPYPPQPTYQQPQQVRRLDPDQMPSPIQVTLDDQKTRSGIFCTNSKGLVPPLVSTNFITQDQGNSGPRYIRSTMYNVPTTSDMMKQTAVPFGLVISPLARTIPQEYPPPIVNFGELGPVRCIRCKAYMSPFMQFIDSGRRFQCLFCKATTEVPAEYFQHLDHTGQRVDRYERPELMLGTYEFVATKDYCRNNTFPKPPAIIFVIDVSYNNVKAGLVHLLCAEMKEILKHLPVDQEEEKTKIRVGFITYNSTVHFYNIKGTLAQPQMLVVGDTQEMFMPLLDGFLCEVEESAAVIDSLMTQIPTMFADTRETETVLLPAIQAGLEALKASECPGKLLVFHSTLPTAEAPGRLKNRDERKLLGTDKERSVLTPQNQAYNSLGQDCVQAGCAVDLFITNNSYIDIATIGQVCRLTGGEVFKYTYFQADVDGQRLINDVINDISRPIAFDSIMRVRTSTGVRPTDFYGHFFMSNTTDMEIAAIDCDKAVAVEIKHDDKLTEEEGVYIQVALLYTSCSGQRRLRILNLSLKTCSQMTELYRSCELDTIINFFSKQCVYRLLENNPKAVKDSLVNRCAQMLACYRKNCASPSSAGQLILPECMKLLPLYVNCILKSDAVSGGSDMTLDDRSFVMQCVTTMDIPTSLVYFYPRLIPLHEIQNGTEEPEIPNPIRCTIEKMTDTGVYLLENGIHMLLWIGLNASPEWIQNVFGVPSAAQVDTDKISLPERDNSLSLAVRNLIEKIRMQRHRCMRLTLVKQRDKLEMVFRHFLVEDRGQDGSSSYVDFLCHMHKEIRQLLS